MRVSSWWRRRLATSCRWRPLVAPEPFVVIDGLVRFSGLWMSDQQIAQALARRIPVVYINPSQLVVPGLRPAKSPVWQAVDADLLVVTPCASPFQARRWGRPVNDWFRRVQLTLLKCLLPQAVSWSLSFGGPGVFRTFSRQPKVYWALDDLTAGSDLLNVDRADMERIETEVADAADHMAVVSESLQRRWRTATREPVLLPNGCDVAPLLGARSLPRPADVELEGPLVGYVGQLSARIDLSLLHSVVDAGAHLLLVGPVQHGFDPTGVEALIARPGVQWVGGKGYAELPAYLGALSCGLVPYVDSEFNRASFPLKIFEYLGVGLPVVSSDIPAAAWLPPEHRRVAGGPDFGELAAREAASFSESAAVRRRAFAQRHSWDARIAAISALVD